MYIKWKTDNGTYLHKPAHNTVTEEKLVATEGHGWDDSMVRSLIGLFTNISTSERMYVSNEGDKSSP